MLIQCGETYRAKTIHTVTCVVTINSILNLVQTCAASICSFSFANVTGQLSPQHLYQIRPVGTCPECHCNSTSAYGYAQVHDVYLDTYSYVPVCTSTCMYQSYIFNALYIKVCTVPWTCIFLILKAIFLCFNINAYTGTSHSQYIILWSQKMKKTVYCKYLVNICLA